MPSPDLRELDRERRTPFPPAEKVGTRLYELALDEGVICRAAGDTLAFCPPLVIGEDELAQAIDRFRRALERPAAERG